MKSPFTITTIIVLACFVGACESENRTSTSGDTDRSNEASTSESSVATDNEGDISSESEGGVEADGTEGEANCIEPYDSEASDLDDDGIPDDCDEDADGDTYLNEHEVLEGTDPLDLENRIYTGYWPYYPHKDELANPPWEGPCPAGMSCVCEADGDCDSGYCMGTKSESYCAPVVGTPIPRFVGTDQFGEEVDLYDFAYQGKIIALDMSTGWCKPCKQIANWILTGNDAVMENVWWTMDYMPIRDLINDGTIYWVTVLYEDAEHGPAGQKVVDDWYEAYPHAEIAVLADAEKELHTWIKPTGIPCVNLLAEDLTMLHYSNRGLQDAFEMLLEMVQ
jgi:hypothetical protein